MTVNTNDTRNPAGTKPAGFWLIYLAVILTLFLAALDQLVVATALPSIVQDLDAVAGLGWVVTGYTLSATLVMPFYGKLTDVFGHRVMFVSAQLVFVLGSLVCGAAPTIEILTLGRVVQGLGGGAIMVGSQAVIASLLPPISRAKYIGPLGALFAVASVVGPPLGGLLTGTIGWRSIFLVNIPLGIVAIVTTLIVLRSRSGAEPRRHHPDVLGSVLLVFGITAVIAVCSFGGNLWPWNSSAVWVTGVGGVLALTALYIVELKVRSPLFPPAVTLNRTVALASLIACLGGAGVFGLVAYLPTYFQRGFEMPVVESGLMLLPLAIGMAGGSTVFGFIVSRTGRPIPIVVCGYLVSALALVGLAALGSDRSIWLTEILILLLASGFGSASQLLIVIVQHSTPAANLGSATGLVTFAREMGVTLGMAVIGSAIVMRMGEDADGGSVHRSPAEVVDAFSPIFLSVSAVFVLGALLCLIMPRIRMK